MISVFAQFGDYENRAKSRTRYLQDTLGVDGLKAEFTKALAQKLESSPKLSVQPVVVDKAPAGHIAGERITEQKQKGLYAVNYHPKGGNLSPEKPRQLHNVIKDMPGVEGRIAPDGSIYFINLTAEEAQKVLDATADSAVTPFQCSVSCIGGTICSTGVRDSQGLLAAMLDAVEQAGLPGNALPKVHVSGCPSSCGTHQSGTLGFQGGAKMVDGKTQPAFTLVIKGSERQGQENLAEAVGVMLESKIPAFIVALGKTVAETGLEFHDWLAENESALRTLAQQYMED